MDDPNYTRLVAAIRAALEGETLSGSTSPRGQYQGAYSKCALCGLTATQIKFCPYCGPEMEHIPPVRRCAACGEQVIDSAASFCGMCGRPLAPDSGGTT